MPLYEYQCNNCGHRFEKIVKFSDEPIEICPQCGKGPVEQLLSAPAVQFKGGGWYVTDYARKSSGNSSSGSDKKSDVNAASETKTESKSESKSDTSTPASKPDSSKPSDKK